MFNTIKKFSFDRSYNFIGISRKFSENVSIAVQRQNELFSNEIKRQERDIGRVDKIEVTVEEKNARGKLYMNKHISTPYHAAQHISQWLMEKSALALVDGQYVWDMHRPLEESCSLNFMAFNDADPFHVNKAFWKSCSFILGAIINSAFSENIKVKLHSFPSPQISSGSFLYDASLSLENWKPSTNELRILSAEMVKFANNSLPLERLQVTERLAKEIFANNSFKLQQIPDIAKQSGGKIIIYRIGTHIDISKGPLIANSSFISRCSISAVHQIESNDGILYRFQGVALPKPLLLNQFAYRILEERAAKLNTSSYDRLELA